MPELPDAYEPSAGALHAAGGIALSVLGALALANVNEDDFFLVIAFALMAGGFYLLVAGAVARGIQMSRN